MDNETFRVVAVAILGLAALAAVVRGTHLSVKGERKHGFRFLLLAATLMIVMIGVIVLRNS
ncbi:MAG: hypothetical protein WA957_06100 [Alteraurantiacibacter sp.]